MKRECLLSSAYSGPPMKLKGVELAYSALVNELVRQLKCAFFTKRGNGDQTDTGGLVEGIMVMYLLAIGDKAKIAQHIANDSEQRAADVTQFYLENEEEVEAIKPQIIARMEAAMAASVESEDAGKPTPDAVQAR